MSHNLLKARLDAARADVDLALRRADLANFDVLEARLLECEREFASSQGDEYAVNLPVFPQWDIGAPQPVVFLDEHAGAFVTYLVPRRSANEDDTTALVHFGSYTVAKFGHPNDEVIQGHPLYGKGLSSYGAHRVVNSRWIAQHEAINSVHSMHRAGWVDRYSHYVLCFHDSTFECIASDFSVSIHNEHGLAVIARVLATLT